MEDAPFTLKQNERGEVVIIIGDDSFSLGEMRAACEEMVRFLAEVDFEERTTREPAETDWMSP